MTIDAMFGSISRNMIRRPLSPVTWEAPTKSLPRIDIACERSTRADPAHPVMTSTRMTVPRPCGRNAARITSSGRPGSSRNTLVTSERRLSTHRPR